MLQLNVIQAEIDGIQHILPLGRRRHWVGGTRDGRGGGRARRVNLVELRDGLEQVERMQQRAHLSGHVGRRGAYGASRALTLALALVARSADTT